MPVDLVELFEASKTIPIAPHWVETVTLRHGATRLRLVAPLDIGAVTEEGLRLMMTALKNRQDQSVTIQLEYAPPRERERAISRIEWRPVKGHNNHSLGPPELRNREIRNTHYHPFEMNWAAAPARVRRGEIPIAVPLNPDFRDLRKALAFAEKYFRIKGLAAVPNPPWQSTLL
jgi:hypothetical protein